MSLTYLRRVVLGEERGALSWVIRALLIPGAFVYSIGLRIYLALYDVGLRRRCRLPVFVVSVGNLTFGGTGKTPAVIAICNMLTRLGKRVVVLSRGHGGTARGPLIVSDGQQVLCSVEESGDEPVLLARAMPGVPVLVDKDRRRSGRLACEKFDPDVVVLDDGLQYWQLHRDLDIVIVSASKPFGSGFLMPAGDLREPVTGLARAGLILITGVDSVSNDRLAALEKRLSELAPAAMIFRARHRPVWLKRLGAEETTDPLSIAGKKVVAFCGIGSPESFAATLRGLNAQVERLFTFPDHHRYSEADLMLVRDAGVDCGAEMILTTEKDAARIEAPCLEGVYVLGIELEIEDAHRFAQYVADRLNRANTQTTPQKATH